MHLSGASLLPIKKWHKQGFSAMEPMTFGLNHSLVGAVLCVVGCYPPGASSTFFPSCDNPKYLQALPDVPWGP